ncbi:MAG: Eco57I restriction-modification methylase domain-containing protein [Chloroflexi bacterium]|nr:Eco57I restriction-modification methylase domain-containing protein [Chloroflexota bacterium]
MRAQIPLSGERPEADTDATREAGSRLPASGEDRARAYGMVATPPEIVEFMVGLCEPSVAGPLDVLEPACGDAPFLRAFVARYGMRHDLTGVDIHAAETRLAQAQMPTAHFLDTDYLLWETEQRFDIIIGNPPYGIIGDASHYPIHTLREHKALYKKRFATWFGKYNIYGAFIEQSVRLLKPEGKAVLVVPATWLVLDDFARLRAFLAHSGKVTIYYLGKAFPKRNVSAVVLVLAKGERGLELYDGMERAVSKQEYRGEIIRFETPDAVAFERSGIPLGECFRVHFAARSPEIRKHPSVVTAPREGCVPILTGRNLQRGRIDYETCYSGLWMPREDAPQLRAFYASPHIVVAHTKGTRVVAAVDWRCYPWREEFHLVPLVGIPDLDALVGYLNSDEVQHYTRALYRDFVPHLTATMLKVLPIPRKLIAMQAEIQLSLWRNGDHGQPYTGAF